MISIVFKLFNLVTARVDYSRNKLSDVHLFVLLYPCRIMSAKRRNAQMLTQKGVKGFRRKSESVSGDYRTPLAKIDVNTSRPGLDVCSM